MEQFSNSQILKSTTLFSLPILITLFSSCLSKHSGPLVRLEGEAQGTTYHISYLSITDSVTTEQLQLIKYGIDSILDEIDYSLSTYNKRSLITKINQADTPIEVDHHFKKVMTKSLEIAEHTGGAFDPTVKPLLDAWGFGETIAQQVDSSFLDSLRRICYYEILFLDGDTLRKRVKGVQVNFNAIAPGYSVDLLAAYLENQGIKNYTVELGGEVRTGGMNQDEEPWRIGIEKPQFNQQQERKVQAIIHLSGKSLSTSGSYRNFYKKDGVIYSHTIDPSSGRPVTNSLLSVSVVGPDCITADGYATALMVMGIKNAKLFLSTHPELEAYFIYDEGGIKTYYTARLRESIEEANE